MWVVNTNTSQVGPHQTVRQNLKPLFGGASVQLRETVRAVTPFGGLAVFAEFLRGIGWVEQVKLAMPFAYHSRNAIGPCQVLTTFMLAVLAGARRFAHVGLLRADQALHAMLGLRRSPGPDAVRDFFRRFDAAAIAALWPPLWKWMFARLPPSGAGGDTLDLDSSVFERRGHQQGAERGYNPGRRGGRSHHPILAVLAEHCFVLHAWLRPGGTTALSGAVEFLREALARLRGAARTVRTLRADAGFYSHELMSELETQGIGYLIIARQTTPILRHCTGIEDWSPAAAGSEVAFGEFSAAVGNWKQPRRFVVLRRPARAEDRQRAAPWLLMVRGWVYRVLVTNRREAPAQLWTDYDGRARIEQRLGELKSDLAADEFCLQSFYATEATLLAVLCLYNLLGEFQRASTPQACWRRPVTLRTEVFLCGAILGRSGQHKVLHFSLAWGGLQSRKPLLDALLRWPPPIPAPFAPNSLAAA